MAEIQYGDVGVGAPATGNVNLAGLVNWLGALISIFLIAGLAWWGYQLMVRDVSGVPVVRALEGPMRITPDDPGGSSAQHQGLAVNNIAAVGETETPADRLVLAPKPTALNSEDQTSADLDQLSGVQTLSATAELEETGPESGLAPGPDLILSDTAEASEPVVADQASLIEATLRLVEDNDSALSAPSEPIAAAPEAIAGSVPGVVRSLLPTLRPSSFGTGVEIVGQDAAGADTVNSVDSGSIPVGTRLAQLGAFETADIAKTEWDKITVQFEDFMAGKSRVIEQAQSGGKVFYRLRAHGFDDLSDARRFCSALLAEQANCIPVVTR